MYAMKATQPKGRICWKGVRLLASNTKIYSIQQLDDQINPSTSSSSSSSKKILIRYYKK